MADNLDLLYSVEKVEPIQEKKERNGSTFRFVVVELRRKPCEIEIPSQIPDPGPQKIDVTHCDLPAVGDLCVIPWRKARDGSYKADEVQWVWEKDAPHEHFIHPYNFVRLPSDDFNREDLAYDSFFKRLPPAPHDHYDNELHTGYIDCRLTTKSHWFIPDPRKRHEQEDESRHKTLGYFTLDPVTGWDHEKPQTDFTRPAIPGASLRGMIRSVFEAATLSCFSVFDPGRLDFRATNSLDQAIRDAQGMPQDPRVRFVPARVVVPPNDQGEGLQIQLLDSRKQADQLPKFNGKRIEKPVMPCGLIQAYTPRVLRGRNPGTQTAHWKAMDETSQAHFGETKRCADGSAVVAIVGELEAHPNPQNVKFNYYPVHWVRRVQNGIDFAAIFPEALSKLKTVPRAKLVFGYLHRTGPNIENKKFERVFFDRDAPFNNGTIPELEKHESADTLHTLFEHFHAAGSASAMPVDAEVARSTLIVLEGYAERDKGEAAKAGTTPRTISKSKPPYPSDFVGRRKLEKGDLFYALVDMLNSQTGDSKDGDVTALYPVAMPRQPHDDTRGDLLPDEFHRCSPPAGEDPPLVCPACRVFGWTREVSDGDSLPASKDRIDAWAGHVRFTNGVYLDDWNPEGDKRPEPVPLAILGAPNPTTTMFYLQKYEHVRFQAAKAQRRPPILNTRIDVPLYRRDEARLRGRKFYRHKNKTKPKSTNYAEGGLMQTSAARSNQNQSVHLLPPGMRFGFRVYFDNLTEEELGALLFALSLRLPEKGDWQESMDREENPTLRHSLGRGKPLGMGTCGIQIINVESMGGTGQPPQRRYDKLDLSVFAQMPSIRKAVLSDPKPAGWLDALNTFGKAWSDVASSAGIVRDDLVEMLASRPPDGPIHYPTRPLSPHFANQVVAPVNNYAWFMEAKKEASELSGPLNDEGLSYNPRGHQ